MAIGDLGRQLIELVEIDLDRCTRTYGVVPCTASKAAGSECYNTFRTCQDKTNYNKGAHTYRFISRGAPIAGGEFLRPYVSKIATVATEIDPEKGLAVRGKVTVTLVDETDSDIEQDPYASTRATAAGATFWTRLVARNQATGGRQARIKRLYITPGSTYTLADAGWTSELYLIDSISGPNVSGVVTLTLKDPLKLTDKQKLPVPTDGELLSSITATDLSLTLKTGGGAQYGASGYVRVDNEVIQFTSRSTDVLSWPSTAYRGKFSATAATHNADAHVQLCYLWSAASVSTVAEELLNAAGILDANIDLTLLGTEVATWLPLYAITLCLTEPETISSLITELCQTVRGLMWWSPTEQKVKFKVNRPLAPNATAPALLTDEASFIGGSVSIARADAQRLTQALVLYGLINATAKKADWQSYGRGYLAVDADAESANEYDDVVQKTYYARFLDVNSSQAAAELAIRMLLARRDAPVTITVRVDPKETGIEIGGQADIETSGLVDYSGTVQRQRVLVTKRQDTGKDVSVTLLSTFLSKRYLWTAPDGHPDYVDASENERRWGYISDDNGLMPDGTDGHVIV